jgi:hypothetical protein
MLIKWIRIVSIVLSLLIVMAAPAIAYMHTSSNGVLHGGNRSDCDSLGKCRLHSHTSYDNKQFKIADLWSPDDQGYFSDCSCKHAHLSFYAYSSCNWDAGNSSAKPYVSYHSHGLC